MRERVRGRVAALLLAACSATRAGAAPDAPASATYSLGGLLSGPYRVSADLVDGVAAEAKPPPGVSGDAAGVRISDLPVTKTRRLTPQELRALRGLAEAVWERGAMSPPRSCAPCTDAIGRIDIVRAGVTRSFDVPLACMNVEAERLVRGLGCAADPERAGRAAR